MSAGSKNHVLLIPEGGENRYYKLKFDCDVEASSDLSRDDKAAAPEPIGK